MQEFDIYSGEGYGRKKKRKYNRWKNGLSPQQLKFCEAYLEHNRDAKKAAEIAGYAVDKNPSIGGTILQGSKIKNYLKHRVDRLTNKTQLTVEKKLHKLSIIIDTAIPENPASIKDISSIGISAIAESNKMQGHYAPEKSINANLNINMDRDLMEVRDKALEILQGKNE